MTGITTGTRFRLFPKFAEGYAEPETVVLSPPRGTVGIGPSDSTMYAINALDKSSPYDPPVYMPPYQGPQLAPARPGPDGNFDHIPVESPEFPPAHLYGVTRFTLDVWERYLTRPVVWWHAAVYPRIELVPVVHWDNAHSGSGFIETGFRRNYLGRLEPFCFNLDVIAHETGHAILFSELGVPTPADIHAHFLAFHESFSDLIALITGLHFPSVAVRLLEQTGGNLYITNLVNRFGEISKSEQIRIVSNDVVMADVAGLVVRPDGTWVDPLGLYRDAHALAQPLTGAIFDILVEIFQDELAARRLIAPELDPRGWTRADVAEALEPISHETAAAFARFRAGFHQALVHARDVVGASMAFAIRTLHPETLTFDRVAWRFVQGAARAGAGKHLPAIVQHFLDRGIDPLIGERADAVAPGSPLWHRLPYAERMRRMTALRQICCGGIAGCGCRSMHDFVHARRLLRHDQRAVGTAIGTLS
ncbi:hypothetical protein GCM10011611_00290 [Aliidongia dinghuensis]|uniref:Peptidase M4 family protein n=1 Tax=Aliidongia dinghuensis TaxID=1867774 RepID=A0A8J3E1C4_9PROT|nr:hypothetical protein [Aliidongia dinghuensis]GGE98723.1 hypothetical protein GCM10011611_00290 [Aliidongia dinghuensis]